MVNKYHIAIPPRSDRTTFTQGLANVAITMRKRAHRAQARRLRGELSGSSLPAGGRLWRLLRLLGLYRELTTEPREKKKTSEKRAGP